ncbi:hypothetical protein FAIPA1_30096 [Frankia sp. AiPs1]
MWRNPLRGSYGGLQSEDRELL